MDIITFICSILPNIAIIIIGIITCKLWIIILGTVLLSIYIFIEIIEIIFRKQSLQEELF